MGCRKAYQTLRKNGNVCSHECRPKARQAIANAKNNVKYRNKTEGYDYVICAICGLKGEKLQFHIQMIHKMTIDEYKTIHNTPIQCKKQVESQSDRIKGINNPAYQHGGKFSPFSDKFIYAEKIDRNELVKQMTFTKQMNPQNENTKLEYYTSRGLSEEEAKMALSQRQTTFSLDKCVEKYGGDEGKKRWSERQEKWLNNFPRNSFSKVSQELFLDIHSCITPSANVYYASYDRDDMKDYQNKEYRLNLGEKTIQPDFIDIDQKKIIEFDGEYWHHGPQVNKDREAERDRAIIEAGYQILHIRERDYRQNKEETIQECLNFLIQ